LGQTTVFKCFAHEAMYLIWYIKKSTTILRKIQIAMHLVLPLGLCDGLSGCIA
jgi:hypothetical protein